MFRNQTFSWSSTILPSTTILQQEEDNDALPDQSSQLSIPLKVVATLPLSSSSSSSSASASSSTMTGLGLFTSGSVSAAMAMTTVTSIAMKSGSEARPDAGAGKESGECHLLGPFALIIQGALGLLALLALVFKRWRERPQRPLKVWAFDASKQVVGSMLLHVANLLMSLLSSGKLVVTLEDPDKFQANPCSFYLLNLAIDTTLGIPILIVILHVLTHAFKLTAFGQPNESIESGNYGSPPKASWWLKQSFIYFLGLLGMKFFVFVIFQLCPWIIRVGNWALKWTEDDDNLQVFFVMLFFPVVMNALQYYIIDSFIKNQKPSDHEQIPSEDEDEAAPEEWRGSDEDYDSASDDALIAKTSEPEAKPPSNKMDEYDPQKDGDRSGGSSSSRGDEGRADPSATSQDKEVRRS